MFLLPNYRFSSIDSLIEQTPDWKNLNSIFINSSEYAKLKENPSFKQNGSIWFREELGITDLSYIPLSFELKQLCFDLWIVVWIEYDGTRQYFTSNPLGRSVHITHDQIT